MSKNQICADFSKKGEKMRYYNFDCPSPGIKGKYITASSFKNNPRQNHDHFSAAEIEVFGKVNSISIIIKFILIKSLIMH